MAKKFLTPLGLVGLASDPATGSEGQLYFNTTDDVVRVYANGAWTELSGAGGEGASVIYSASQPDVTGLNVGTIWVDSDAVITGGGGGGGGTGGPSFQTIITSPVSASIVAQTAGEVLTLISGSNVYITNASANNSITIGVNGIQEQIDNLITSIGPSSASATASRITAYIKNGSTALAKGVPVYVTGADGTNIIVGPASNASESTSSKTLGFTQTALNSNQHGYIVLEGSLEGLNTNGATEGDPIWLGETPGTVIYGLANKPKAPNHLVYLGVVSRVNSNNGKIFVKIQNGFELNELHDVRITSIQNDDLIVYNSASSIWVNSPKQNIINTASAAAVSYLVDGAPAALNTLNELAAALNDNENILSTLLTTTAASSTYLPLSSSASFYRWTKTYSASASVISGVDNNSISLSYNAGYIQLFINGVMLDPSEYTATNGTSITVTAPVLSGEVVDIFAFRNSTSVNTYSQAQINDAFLTKSSASTTYLTQSSASTTYLTQSSASTAYLTQSNGITAATASATYIPLSSPVSSYKNKIINGGFDIWQRGTTFSTGGYTADRWLLQVDGSSATRAVSQQALTPGSITGYESSFFLRYNQSIAGSSTTFNILDQRIEDVRTLAGQVVTVSFWAKADSSRTITSSIQQVFGTGGSSEVAGLASGNINITTSWTRYSYTGTLASISGKTVGTNSYAAFRINFPINATFTVDIWGVQVERGSIATEFEQRFIGDELRMCHRYFWRGFVAGGGGWGGSGGSVPLVSWSYPVRMRIAPIWNWISGGIAGNGNQGYNITGTVTSSIQIDSALLGFSISGNTGSNTQGCYVYDSLNSFSAEL